VDQVGDAGDLEILVQFVLLGRRTDGDAQARIADAPQQIGHRREGAHQRQVLGLEALAAPLLQFLAVVLLLFGGQKFGNELVATLSDLTSRLLGRRVRIQPSLGIVYP
jgi:hypothetical protein